MFNGRVIFDHLPKTAGQAVNAWFRENLGTGAVTDNSVGMHQALIKKYGGLYPIISAHVAFDGKGLTPHYQYITCIREPIDRAISWLFFVVNNHTPDQYPGLWEAAHRFITSDGEDHDVMLDWYIQNPYIEHFSNIISTRLRTDDIRLQEALMAITHYDLWGLYEDMPQFINDVRGLLHIREIAPMPRFNVTKGRPTVHEISPALHAKLTEINLIDLQFYQTLKDWYANRTDLHNHKSSSKRYRLYKPAELYFCIGNPPVQITNHALRLHLNVRSNGVIEHLGIRTSLFDHHDRLVLDATHNARTSRHTLAHPGHYRIDIACPVHHLPQGTYKMVCALSQYGLKGYRELLTYESTITFSKPDSPNIPSQLLTPALRIATHQIDDMTVHAVNDTTGIMTILTPITTIGRSEQFRLDVELLNLSTQSWKNFLDLPINLSYHWQSKNLEIQVHDGIRTPLHTEEVLPQIPLRVPMQIQSPEVAGHYTLVLIPVQEGVCWFDERGFTSCLIDVEVQ